MHADLRVVNPLHVATHCSLAIFQDIYVIRSDCARKLDIEFVLQIPTLHEREKKKITKHIDVAWKASLTDIWFFFCFLKSFC
jgi:hypothetical protein